MKKRVVITGMGAVTPVGNELNDIWSNLLAGKSGVRTIDRYENSEIYSKVAGLVNDFSSEGYIDPKEARRMDLFIQYGMVAGIKAFRDSGLTIDEKNNDRIGVIVSSGIGGMETFSKQHEVLMTKGAGRISPFFVPMLIPNILSGYLSISIGAKGPNLCVVTACASGTHSIGEAFKIIQRGDADAMLAGGAEAPILPIGVGGFCALKALSARNDEPTRASRPFDKDRDGFVIAEGAGVIMLEDYEHAKARGAKIYAEIVGYGLSGDAYHITAPQDTGDGAIRAMKMAIKDAGIKPEDLQYINAHGTSTDLNDPIETRAIKAVFGAHAQKLLINSSKSMSGHMLGAAGGFEAIVMALSIQKSKVHQTLNLENPDPECDLNYVPGAPKDCEIQYALSTSLGFGGHNGVVLFKKYE